MKAHVRLKNSTIEVEGATQKELFSEMAKAHEVFGESQCGLCKSDNVKPIVRHVVSGKKTYDYYEIGCVACKAKLTFGCALEGGGLFPVRKLTKEGKPDREKGEWGPHNGWTRYRGEPVAPV